MKRILALSIAILVTSLSPLQSYALQEKNPYGTATIDPAGPNEIILTITNGSHKVDFAYARLQKVRHTTITIYEPFLKVRQEFTVVSLKTLFNMASIKGGQKVITRALNDYTFTAKASEFLSSQGYLAIERNGAPIAYDQGGPIRIIFPDGSKWAKNLDAWNWSINSISVK